MNHDLCYALAEEKHCFEIGVYYSIEFIFVGVDYQLVIAENDPCIIDEDVNAPKALHSYFYQIVLIFTIAYIAVYRHDSSTRLLGDFLCAFFNFLFIDIGNYQIRPIPGISTCYGATDSYFAANAGN